MSASACQSWTTKLWWCQTETGFMNQSQGFTALGVFVGPCGSTDQNIFSDLSCFLFGVYDSTSGGIKHFARMIFLHGYIILFLFYCVEQNDKNPLWVEPSTFILFFYLFILPQKRKMSAFFWICFLSGDQFQSSSFFSCSENMWGKNRDYFMCETNKKEIPKNIILSSCVGGKKRCFFHVWNRAN